MSKPFDGGLSPTPRYYEILGRAAEIARSLGSKVGGAEHLFLGMLHDGGGPVNVISGLIDPGRAEAAITSILNSPAYSPPPLSGILVYNGQVQLWGGDVAVEMGDSYIGVEHAFLAMIRRRETVPARALAGLADLNAVEAAVLEAKNAPASPPESAVFLPEGRHMDAPLGRALASALPDGTTFGFNNDTDQRTWVQVIGPGDSSDRELTLQVLNTARASINGRQLDG